MDHQFQCDICKKKYVRKDNMRDHILQLHAGKKPKCKLCGKKMRSTALSRHMKYHCIKKNESDGKNIADNQDRTEGKETPSEIWLSSQDPLLSFQHSETFDISVYLIFN